MNRKVARIYLQINHIHLLTNALECSLGTESRNICSYISMCLPCNLLQVHVVLELHIFGVNAEAFHPTSLIWNTDVDLTVETTKTTEGGINAALQRIK